jgi:hypothetical protein
MAKRKRTNNDLEITTKKTKNRATRTPLKTVGDLRRHRRVSSSCSASGTHRVTLVCIRYVCCIVPYFILGFNWRNEA